MFVLHLHQPREHDSFDVVLADLRLQVVHVHVGRVGPQQDGMPRNSLNSVAGKFVGQRILEVGANRRIVAHADHQHLLEAVSGIAGILHAGHQLGRVAVSDCRRGQQKGNHHRESLQGFLLGVVMELFLAPGARACGDCRQRRQLCGGQHGVERYQVLLAQLPPARQVFIERVAALLHRRAHRIRGSNVGALHADRSAWSNRD